MTEVLEKVAVGLWRKSWELEYGPPAPPALDAERFAGLAAVHRERFHGLAQAALTALADNISEGMVEELYSLTVPEVTEGQVIDAFRAMIQAALTTENDDGR